MTDSAPTPPIRFPREVPAPLWAVWSIRALALAGLAVASYLSYLALSGQTAPGCAPGQGGCGEVLGSRWSTWLGVVPVSLPAVAVYLAVLVASLFIVVRPTDAAAPDPAALTRAARRGRAWLVMIAAAVAITGAAVWFLLLQLAVIHRWCIYCVTEHAIGLSMSTLILAGADLPGVRARLVPPAVGAGMLVIALLIGGQVVVKPRTMRTFTFVGSSIEVKGDWPMLGDRDAPYVIASMFDYRCPHCRAMHTYLAAARKRYGDQFAIIAMPLPQNASCNDTVFETSPRFEDSCDLARTALAVHVARPDLFDAFDAWLFEPEEGRTAVEARAKAIELVGEAALDDALTSGEPQQLMRASIGIHKATLRFGQQEFDRVPKLLVGDAIFVSRPADADELFEAMEQALPLHPVDAAGR